ncbi:hypothetical protein [Rhizobium mongolense]|uniref:hypothetical protein n=1 Tax=Rhizobium mongolense TaxID=57676 RepID=UPI0034A0D3AF
MHIGVPLPTRDRRKRINRAGDYLKSILAAILAAFADLLADPFGEGQAWWVRRQGQLVPVPVPADRRDRRHPTRSH